MIRIFTAMTLLLVTAAAPAQPVYKCNVDGTLVYADQPCAKGAVEQLEVPAAPPRDLKDEAELKRQKAKLAKLEKERHKREAKDSAEQARYAKAAAKQHKRCAKLRLAKKWADENLSKAAGFDKEALREKARRQGQLVALECPA